MTACLAGRRQSAGDAARNALFPVQELRLSVRRFGWFIAVGTLAAAVHLGTVVALVQWAGWSPPAANVAGWLVAFVCSFVGHYRTTFSDAAAPMGRAARRFFVVSALGFGVNQVAYVTLLKLTFLRYDIALALVLIGVAVMTYVLGRHWAFQPAER